MDELHHLADQFHFKMHDYCENHNDPRFEALNKAMEHFIAEIKSHQTPDKLMWHLKDIEKMVEPLKHTEEVFKYRDTDDLHDRCEDMRKLLDKLERQ